MTYPDQYYYSTPAIPPPYQQATAEAIACTNESLEPFPQDDQPICPK